jgi:hypothetical protein
MMFNSSPKMKKSGSSLGDFFLLARAKSFILIKFRGFKKWVWLWLLFWEIRKKQTVFFMNLTMSVIDLYHNGTINYLFKRGLISQTVPTYIDYFMRFSSYRNEGMTYREAVSRLSQECSVSETTIKKAIKTIRGSIN